jgi:hypothetical protein
MIARRQVMQPPLPASSPHALSSPLASSAIVLPSASSLSLLEPQLDQYHPLYEIMSILSTKERRWQCSRVCRYWSIIVTHPFANRHLLILYDIQKQNVGYHIDNNDGDTQKRMIPFNSYDLFISVVYPRQCEIYSSAHPRRRGYDIYGSIFS